MHLKSVENLNTTVLLREDGILEVIPNPGYKGTEGLEQVKRTLRALDILSMEVGDFLILAGLPDRIMTKEARDFLNKPELNRLPDAIALLARNKFQQILGNVIMYFSSPIKQIRLFTSENEAIYWLKEKSTAGQRSFAESKFNLFC